MKLKKFPASTPPKKDPEAKPLPFKKSREETPKYKDIREVVDKTRPFNMFFSGVESDSYFTGCFNMGVRNFLMSYQYLRTRRDAMTRYEGTDIKFFIDSGAFTYQNDPKYMEYDIPHWEKHIQHYLSWAERHKDYIFAMANLDLERLVGGDQVLEWNEKYFEPFMLRTGIPVCFVWHEQSTKSWEWYCQRYPYAGFSAITDDGVLDMADFKNRLSVAEKYDTLVHGFGMTRTGSLPQLPFYTVDSISWKSGFMYGQLAFWNGKKVQNAKKDEFETKAFKWTRMYDDLDPPLDEKLLHDYNEPEVLRANVYAYLKAEEFIQLSLKSRMYWMKPKTTKRKVEDLDSLDWPTPEWLEATDHSTDEIGHYAALFNISMENPIEALNLVIDMTCFYHWENFEYQEYIDRVYTHEVLKEIHDTYINRIVETDEERVNDLRKFYLDNLLGDNTTLLYLGTNFDRTVKERDEYITDEEYDEEDVSDIEVQGLLSKFLPAPKEGDSAPEISELDDEIFREAGIEPVRDAQGKFLKGQRKVARPKKLYSDKFPKMACDRCVNAQTCPEYKPGYVCAYNKMFQRYETRDMGDVIQAMQGITDFSMQRLQRGMMSEVLNGGMPDPAVSQMMNQTMGLLTQLQRMYELGNREVIKQTKVLRADGTQEMTTSVSNPQSGGILASIFGGMTQTDEPDPPEKVIEAEVVEVEEEEPKDQ